jgi:hypothetical protein
MEIKMPPEMKQLLMDCLSKNTEIADSAQKKLAKLLELPLLFNIIDELHYSISEYRLE